jgi:tRNA pseudouridine55 synthase
MTSNDVVQQLKSVLKRSLPPQQQTRNAIKIGHGGTLDPLAEGVLVIGVGAGTKMLSSYLSGSKGYRAVAKLGVATDSLDAEGKVVATADASHVTAEALRDALVYFRGDIQQIPPMFSALRKNGERLYELARKGEVVERAPRNVTVYRLELVTTADQSELSSPSCVSIPPEGFVLDIECSGGFYVRTVIDDLAKKVDSLAHMTALLRTKQGVFTLRDCLPSDPAMWTVETIARNLRHCERRLRDAASTEKR